jgi:two-component system response regulator VicR
MRRLLGRAAVAPAKRAPRVVIVEDEVESHDFTRFVLEREGYEVTCLASGTEALRTIGAETDLVLLDIALEESDGLDICRSLKAQAATRDVPILIMTAMSGEEVRKGSLGAGADGYLMKPFGVDEFLRQVKLHLRGPTHEPNRDPNPDPERDKDAAPARESA